MRQYILCFVLPVMIIVASLASCTNESEEELYGVSPCDTSDYTYDGTIARLMALNCNYCHSGANASQGIHTNNYNDLVAIAQTGRLKGAVNHDPGYVPMPQNGGKLGQCDLTRLNLWIDNGMPK